MISVWYQTGVDPLSKRKRRGQTNLPTLVPLFHPSHAEYLVQDLHSLGWFDSSSDTARSLLEQVNGDIAIHVLWAQASKDVDQEVDSFCIGQQHVPRLS
jgi:hypothetical protein